MKSKVKSLQDIANIRRKPEQNCGISVVKPNCSLTIPELIARHRAGTLPPIERKSYFESEHFTEEQMLNDHTNQNITFADAHELYMKAIKRKEAKQKEHLAKIEEYRKKKFQDAVNAEISKRQQESKQTEVKSN